MPEAMPANKGQSSGRPPELYTSAKARPLWKKWCGGGTHARAPVRAPARPPATQLSKWRLGPSFLVQLFQAFQD